MGLSSTLVRLNLELSKQGYYKNIKSVAECGSQEIHMGKDEFEALLKRYNVTNYVPEKLPPWNFPGQPRCPSRVLYEMLGVEKYTSIDLNGEHGSIKIDLNFPLEDKSLYNRFDMVTDFGCNEHAFNMAEAYRTLHRLCKPQGLMVCTQSVWKGNGYYLIDKSFYEGIAAANGYKIICASYIISLSSANIQGEDQFHLPLSDDLLDALNFSKLQGISICYVMSKQSDADFRLPYQDDYLAQVQGCYGYEVQFHSLPPARSYVPIIDVDNLKIKYLLKQLYKRARKKLVKNDA